MFPRSEAFLNKTISHIIRISIMSEVMEIRKLAQLLLWIYKTRYSGFFYVKFIKRTDGSIRRMKCKISDKYTKGGQLLYDVVKKRLINVMDVDLIQPYKQGLEKSCYRSINLDGLISVSFEKRHIVAKGQEAYD